MSRCSYTYSILRYFHDITAGECVNVGVALYCPKHRYVAARVTRTPERAALLFPDMNKDAFLSALAAVEHGFSVLQQKIANLEGPHEATVLDLARSVLMPDDSSLKWGSYGSGLTDNPAFELEKIYRRMVSRYELPDVVAAVGHLALGPVGQLGAGSVMFGQGTVVAGALGGQLYSIGSGVNAIAISSGCIAGDALESAVLSGATFDPANYRTWRGSVYGVVDPYSALTLIDANSSAASEAGAVQFWPVAPKSGETPARKR